VSQLGHVPSASSLAVQKAPVGSFEGMDDTVGDILGAGLPGFKQSSTRHAQFVVAFKHISQSTSVIGPEQFWASHPLKQVAQSWQSS